MVANATADTKDIRKSPPSAPANSGAAIFPAAFASLILSNPTNAAAPNPKKIVKT